MSDKIVLIDGHSMLNRAFYGVPDLTNSQGQHTNAVFGFLNILFRILEEEHPQYLAVAFDVSAPTFRHKMYDAYKGTRKAMPEELREQVPLLKELLRAMQVPCMEQAGLEADDILGTMAVRSEAAGLEVSLVSGDRDLLQLATDHIKIRIPKTQRGKTEIHDYYAADVKTDYGVTPTEFIEVKALMGDASDNIPGVPSIGEKTATKLIQQYGCIEEAYAHVDEVKPPRASNALKEHYDMAQLSKTLATIHTDCNIPFSLEDATLGNLYTPEAYVLVKFHGFRSLFSRFEATSSDTDDSLHIETISDAASRAALFLEALSANHVGMALASEKDGLNVHLYGAALSFSGKTTFLPVCESQSETELARALGLFAADCHALWLPDLKQALSVFAPVWEKEELIQVGDALLPAGQNPTTLQDLHLAAYLLNPLNPEYTCDEIAAAYLNKTIPGWTDLAGKTPMADLPADKLSLYLGNAAWACDACGPVLTSRLESEGMTDVYKNIDLPLSYSLYRMEHTGIAVKKDELVRYGANLTESLEKLEQDIYELAGETFNILSPKQLGEILFEKMHCPYAKKTKTGYSTSADVLEKLAPDYPLVQKVLDYRQMSKLKSTYAVGLAAFIQDDGRIHGKFHQTVTATGRLSSADPNLQNIPVRMELGRAIRKVFVPRENWVFVDADYSQIELRILAHMSGDESLIAAYNSAQDIHAITASQVFHVPLSEVTPALRRNAKAVNFGIVYGISAFGLSEDLSISRKEATEYIERYFATYPKIKQFLDGLVSSAKKTGASVTMFGRKRPVPELSSSNFMQRSFGERVAMNAPIQGSAADIMKLAMIRVDSRLRAEGLAARLVLQVHDELMIEAPVSEEAEVRRILAEEMPGAADLAVKLEVEVSSGHSCFETK